MPFQKSSSSYLRADHLSKHQKITSMDYGGQWPIMHALAAWVFAFLLMMGLLMYRGLLATEAQALPTTSFKNPFKRLEQNLRKMRHLSHMLHLLNIPADASIFADVRQDLMRDALDSAEENFIERQTGQEFSHSQSPLLDHHAPTILDSNSAFNVAKRPLREIKNWLQQQECRCVYKNFDSMLFLNGTVFHLNDIVAPVFTLKWVDVDPIDKQLFFLDAQKNRYAIHY